MGINAIIILAIGIALIIWWAYAASNSQRKQREADALPEAVAARAAVAEEARLRSERLRDAVTDVKYLTGHPEIISPVDKAAVTFDSGNNLMILSTVGDVLARIPISDVRDVSAEDASTVEKRITATRLLTVGIFAFAAKKKEKHELHYVSVKWADGRFEHETMFEFEGKDSAANSNILRSRIIQRANAPVAINE